jgi:arginase family enzyme
VNPCLHLDLDGAWPLDALSIPTLHLRELGPRLRFITNEREMRAFEAALSAQSAQFFLYGSGDFHHLAAALIRRSAATTPGPITVVSFDNHPDWDIRPPRWACGAWVNRALEIPNVECVNVWGCGNFELAWPHDIFRNRWAIRGGQLRIFPWAERQTPSTARRFPSMKRDNWHDHFQQFAADLAGKNIYVTIDMDCLRKEEAITDWETGLFTADDVAWALTTLRQSAIVVAGDICGATSPQKYARAFQRFAGWWDHPKLLVVVPEDAQSVNLASLKIVWPALAARGSS